jgi:hypothetical protein
MLSQTAFSVPLSRRIVQELGERRQDRRLAGTNGCERSDDVQLAGGGAVVDIACQEQRWRLTGAIGVRQERQSTRQRDDGDGHAFQEKSSGRLAGKSREGEPADGAIRREEHGFCACEMPFERRPEQTPQRRSGIGSDLDRAKPLLGEALRAGRLSITSFRPLCNRPTCG